MEDVTKILTITDASTAYTLELGFVPDYVEVTNVTQWEVQNKTVKFFWYNNMGAGAWAGLQNENANPPTKQAPVGETTNGFTVYDTSSFAARQVLIDTGATKITQALHPVVTSTAHGLVTGDKITFQGIWYGMTQINGLSTKITRTGASTFTCDDIDSTSFTAWDATLTTGQFIKTSARVSDVGFRGIILGTDVLDSNSDVMIVRAVGSNNYDEITT